MPACRNCGTELSDAATVCSNCGTPVEQAPQEPAAAPTPWPAPTPAGASTPAGAPTLPGAPTSDERNWAMFAHLSALAQFIGIPWIAGPLVIWLVKRNESAYVDFHGKEAVNFNISAFLYFTGATIVGSIVGILTLGLGFIPLAFILFAAGIAWAVFVVIAGIKASQAEAYRYPLTIRFVK